MKIFIGLATVIFGLAGYFLFTFESVDEDIAEQTQSAEESTVEAAQPVSDINSYRSDEWGISFGYPKAWKADENNFRAASSKFNISLSPEDRSGLPWPVILNFTPAEWGETLLQRNSDSVDINVSEFNISGISSYFYPSADMGIPTIVYLAPVNDEYWLMVVGKEGYETELKLVLDTLEITPVDISDREPGVSL